MGAFKTFLAELPGPLPQVFWAAVGAVFMHLWRRYRNRMVVLRWQASHQHVAAAGEDNLFGKVEVLYNDSPVLNVCMTSVEVENESTSDLTDVELDLYFEDGTIVYMAHGAVQGSANVLPFTDEFHQHLVDFPSLPADDPDRLTMGVHLSRRRDFRVPVFNRGAKVNIALLVQAPAGQTPFLKVACDHPGVRLVAQGPRQLVFGVDRNVAALAGLFIGGLVVLIVVPELAVPLWAAAFVAFLVGGFTSTIGAFAVRAYRWAAKLLS